MLYNPFNFKSNDNWDTDGLYWYNEFYTKKPVWTSLNQFHGLQKTGPRWSGSVPAISGSVLDRLRSMVAHFGGKKPDWTGLVNTSREREDASRSHSLREGSPLAKGRMGPFIEGGRMPAVHRGREDASRSSREGGCLPFVEGGRSPFVEGGRPPFVEGGRPPFVEGGRPPFVEGGRPPFVERGRRPFIDLSM